MNAFSSLECAKSDVNLLPIFFPAGFAERFDQGEKIMEEIAKSGDLDIMKWARSQGCPFGRWTCAYAAKAGHLELLKWARSQGCRWDIWTCMYAAEGGHLELLKWARSQGCPWDEDTCSYAARGGHLELLKWARSQGCPEKANQEACIERN